MLVANRDLRIVNFDPTVSKVATRVEPWQGKSLASGGRLALVNDCLTYIPVYIMGFYLLQDGMREELDKVRSRFF